MKNFNVFDGDIDYTLSDRIIMGRLTKKRYQIIQRYCRVHTKRNHCGCAHDCCGHITGTNMSMDVIGNMVYLRYSVNYNY